MANIIIRPELKQFVLSILQVGYEKCDSKHFYGPCKRGIYVLHVVVNGRGIFSVNGKEAEIRKGDLFLVPPKEVTFYRADAEDPYEYYWFAFQGSNVRELLINAGFLKMKFMCSTRRTCMRRFAMRWRSLWRSGNLRRGTIFFW